MSEEGEYERGPAAQRIEEARQRSGATSLQIARDLDLGEDCYLDIERYDEDIFTCASVDQVCRLAERLGLDVEEMLALPRSAESRSISMPELASLISEAVRRQGVSLDAFEDQVGWGGMARVLESPETAWRAWNLDALQDVCRAVGVSWRTVLASWSQS